jgi:multicomponent Na+:H+ antiporter subunit G
MTALAVVLVVAGVVFLGVSSVGLVRFPDFYSRTHVVAKSETLGIMLVMAGVMVHHRFRDGTLHLLLLIGFAMVANATAIHALASAARRQEVAGDLAVSGHRVPGDAGRDDEGHGRLASGAEQERAPHDTGPEVGP